MTTDTVTTDPANEYRPIAPMARRLVIGALLFAIVAGVGVGAVLFESQSAKSAEARRVGLDVRVIDGSGPREVFSARLILVERSTAPGTSIWLLLREAGVPAPSSYLPASMQLRLADDATGQPTAVIDGLAAFAVPGVGLTWSGTGTVEGGAESAGDERTILTRWTQTGTEVSVEIDLQIGSATAAAAAHTVDLTAEELAEVWSGWLAGARADNSGD